MISCLQFLLLTLVCHEVICLPTVTDVDVDDGQELDIIDINEGLDLFEGDILYDENQERNAILGDKYRWPTTVPYYLEDNLEINAKGVILKAFEQYRLKTCIDFTPWTSEHNYISVFKGDGCYSSVGNRRVGKQGLSIGANCDRIATIEHEFLHALGFWHEQSRSDRDNYVTIMWDNIKPGKEHNFNKYNDSVSTSLNVPYDYGSVMHYSKNSFRAGSEPTIVTKIPEFMDVIGQRMEFSDSDLLKLNRLYNCTSSSTFLDTCSFELANICGMIQDEGDDADWTRVTSVPAGPHTDYTNMGVCKGTGYFMHFSTAVSSAGNRAYLESRLFYPQRSYQCLQFYYYNSGSCDDQLDIWIREYDGVEPEGTLKRMESISGSLKDAWQLHHVRLNASRKFQVVFQGTKGAGQSSGGLSIDDINLSETECPEHMWPIKGFQQLLATTSPGKKIYSPRFLSKEGYTFQIGLYLNGKTDNPGELGIYLHLTSGDNDDALQWPCPWKQVTMMLMDQNPDIQHRMSKQRSITTDPQRYDVDANGNREYFWDDPRKVGSRVTDADGSVFYRGPGRGTSSFLTHERVRSRNFIKGGDAIFLFTMEDLSGLLKTQPAPPASPCSTASCDNTEVCMLEKGKAICRSAAANTASLHQGGTTPFPGLLVAAVMGAVSIVAGLAVASVSIAYVRRHKQRLGEPQGGTVLENALTL